MFEITNAEKLRDAYTLLAFIRDDVPTTTAEQKSGLAAFMVSIKKEIRAYNNRPAPDSHIIEEHGVNGYIELVRLPDELDKVNEDDAAEWFNYAGFFWMQCTEKQLAQMRMLLKAQNCKTTMKNGEEWYILNSGTLIKVH